MKRIIIITLAVILLLGGIVKVTKFLSTKKNIQNIQPVAVKKVIEKEVFDSTQSAGRLEAKYSVNVTARINGWLEKRYFQEGAFVKKGQTLFLIEPREYSIAVSQAQASLNQANAALINAEKELKRAAELVKNDFVSKSYYDNALANRDQAKASYDMQKANLANAKLNLSYTNIVSPIDGKIGKIFITEGNLVNPEVGALATIISTDPMYTSYTLKSQDYIKFKNTNQENFDLSNVKVELKLADGSTYPISGKIIFIDNKVDPTTGTISLRASFDNPNNILVPGDYVTVTSTLIKPHKYILVPQIAVQKNTQTSFVYSIDEKGLAKIVPIEVGKQVEDCWEVLSGLNIGDTVIVDGLASIRPGMPVKVLENVQKENQKI